jgi:hypothetical protein
MGGLEAGDSSVVARLTDAATAVGPEAQRGAIGGDQRGHFHDVLGDRQSVRLDDVAADTALLDVRRTSSYAGKWQRSAMVALC